MDLDIYVTDLFRVREGCTALRNKDVLWINNILIGLNNPGYIIYASIPPEKMMCVPLIPLRVPAMRLSKLCSNLTTEEKFSFHNVGDRFPDTLSINVSWTSLDLTMSLADNMTANNTLAMIRHFDSILEPYPEIEATNQFKEFASATKIAGAIKINPEPGYLMMIPVNALPLARSDKIYMKYGDIDANTYMARYRICKKIYTVTAFMCFLKVPQR